MQECLHALPVVARRILMKLGLESSKLLQQARAIDIKRSHLNLDPMFRTTVSSVPIDVNRPDEKYNCIVQAKAAADLGLSTISASELLSRILR